MTAAQNPGPLEVRNDLNDTEWELLKAAAAGTLVDRRTGDPDLDNPANGAGWSVYRSVRANFLADLLTGDQPTSTGRLRSVKLSGARITGTLDLEARTLLCPLTLQNCYIDSSVNLKQAEAVSIHLPGCHVPAFDARQIKTSGDIDLNEGFHAGSGVTLYCARIGGQLNLSDARIINRNGPALLADRLIVAHSVFCNDLTVHGETRMPGAQIEGMLTFRGAFLANQNGYALTAFRVMVSHEMSCRDAVIFGSIDVDGSCIGDDFTLTGAKIHCAPRQYAVLASNLTVGNNVVGDPEFTSQGSIALSYSQIGAVLSFRGAVIERIHGSELPALNADGINVAEVFFHRLTAIGGVSMTSSSVTKSLTLDQAACINPRGRAFMAEGLSVGRGMFCREGFQADGEIQLVRANVGGMLNMNKAKLSNKGFIALRARSMTVGQDLFCAEGFTAIGEVDLRDAKIRRLDLFGEFDLRTPAVMRQGERIREDTGAKLANPGGVALNLAGAALDALHLPRECPDGIIDLTNSKVNVLTDHEEGWPKTLRIRGFTYDYLTHPGSVKKYRLKWLRRHSEKFTPQIYDQLADVYRRMGDDGAARRTLVTKQWRRRKWYSPLNWIWWATVGYGYRTWQAFLWAAGLACAGWLVFSGAFSPVHMMPVNPSLNPPRFQPLVYTLDVLLPIGGLGQKSAWQATGVYLDWYWAFAIAGWVLSAAVVAGLTGILKRD